MSKPISIAGQCFPSKASAIRFIKSILYRYSIGQHVGYADAPFLMSLFERHPDWEQKRGCGVKAIRVEKNVGCKQGFWLERLDGTTTDISFRKCISPPTHAQRALSAFRREIRSQIKKYRDENIRSGECCSVTGVKFGPSSEIHVDHYNPTFIGMVESFLIECGLTLDDIELYYSKDGIEGERLLDPDLSDEWYRYHKKNCNLRLVTAAANCGILRKIK